MFRPTSCRRNERNAGMGRQHYYNRIPLTEKDVEGIQLGGTTETMTRRLILDHGGPKAADIMEDSMPGIGRAFTRRIYRKMLDAKEIAGKPDEIKADPPQMVEPPAAEPVPHFQDRD